MAWRFEYADGLRATMLLVEGLVQDITTVWDWRSHANHMVERFLAGSSLPVTYWLAPVELPVNGVIEGALARSDSRSGAGLPQVQSTQFFLGPRPKVTYSACLMGKVEEMIVSGRAPFPLERTLLVSGTLERCLESRISGHRRLATPELKVSYRAPGAS